MGIIYDKNSKKICITTKNTVYAMEIYENRFPLHLYYGADSSKIPEKFVQEEYFAFEPYYSMDYYPGIALKEWPTFGDGDFRTTALKIRKMSTGCDITEFTFKDLKIFKGRKELNGLPFADADDNTETLELILEDAANSYILYLYYTVFPECDTISRYFILENHSDSDIRIEKCMMLSLDINSQELDMISFYGAWNNERNFQRSHLPHGTQSIYSRRGSSSHYYNPFFMVVDRETNEESGSAYGFNLVYSGNFLAEAETNHSRTTRIVTGLGSEHFNYLLKPNESFTSPEAVMTYSPNGIGQVSRNFHNFIRSHILPPEKAQQRPIVLNSWEAFYFSIDEDIMLDFASRAKEIDIDTVVVDDGWYGKRENEKSSLGDWVTNTDKFKGGLPSFVKKVCDLGVNLGIWIEPEMVNPDSDLYRAHPDWAITSPNKKPLLIREQLILDMSNPQVIQYLKDAFAKLFGKLPITYIKWDMNRNMTDTFSNYLPAERQGEFPYRYMLGVYELFRWFNEFLPNVMIENCSGGGGRFDLGMMKYSSQIWTSDNTLPQKRVHIQYGSSFGYPATVMSCHVANHDNSCEDERLLDYGYRVASGGILGYEFDVLKISEKTKASIKAQIAEYNQYRDLITNGDFYRILSPYDDEKYAYYFVNEDNSKILLAYLQNRADEMSKEITLKISRADENEKYVDILSNKTYNGSELKDGIKILSKTDNVWGATYFFVKL